MDKLLFESWTNLLRTVYSSAIMFVAVVIALRILGQRTTSKMNNFDWVVTVAIGSIVASAIALKSVPVAEGFAGVLALGLLQYLVTKMSIWWKWFRKLIHSNPILLFYKGEFIEENMRRARVTREEVFAAMRVSGHCNLDTIHGILLESGADIGIIPKSECEEDGTSDCLEGFDLPLELITSSADLNDSSSDKKSTELELP